jgi:hypothetical protein
VHVNFLKRLELAGDGQGIAECAALDPGDGRRRKAGGNSVTPVIGLSRRSGKPTPEEKGDSGGGNDKNPKSLLHRASIPRRVLDNRVNPCLPQTPAEF